jgi:hypothetical protein
LREWAHYHFAFWVQFLHPATANGRNSQSQWFRGKESSLEMAVTDHFELHVTQDPNEGGLAALGLPPAFVASQLLRNRQNGAELEPSAYRSQLATVDCKIKHLKTGSHPLRGRAVK